MPVLIKVSSEIYLVIKGLIIELTGHSQPQKYYSPKKIPALKKSLSTLRIA
jgi:hypothetical protein